MDCLICGAEDKEVEGFGLDLRYDCEACGEYRVSSSLHGTLRGRAFDIDRARAEIARQKAARRGAADWRQEVPVLSTDHEYLLKAPG
ncbi:hypothetical protein D3C77_410310 [compost metagenome]